MNIPASQIVSKKIVGKLQGDPVIHLSTIGGLHLIVVARDRKRAEPLGTGSHPVIARNGASNKHPIEWTDLEKSEPLDPSYFGPLVEKYDQLTNEFREAAGYKD